MLGGGAGGITAAFELTRNGEFDVTVYQLGWRLGGKGASGRNAAIGSRIEEHGLHVWFGFYANAFALMRDAYQELHRPSSVPIATIDQAFRRCNQMVLYDYVGGDWFAHAVGFPTNGPDPWRGTRRLPTFWGVAHAAVRRARAAIAALGPTRGSAPADAELARAENLASNGLRSLHAPIPTVSLKRFVRKLQNACRKLAAAWANELANPAAYPALRLVFTTIDAFTAIAVGILEDELLVRGFGAVDGCDWACWMKHHGASSITIPPDFRERAPAVRSVYDVAFCFPDGDVDKASAAAGTATSNLLRLQFAYRGAIAYKMSAGMGDVVFAPLYEVLHRRKVKFRFFHAVTHLGLSPDGRRVDSIEVVPQVDLRGVGEYDPLVEVKGLPCWPNMPLWDQLEEGTSAKGTSFETELNPLGRDCKTLRLGHNFDYVVLAIPPAALCSICGDLMEADARFKTMVDGSRSVATQAFQLWTLESQRSLGFAHSPDSIVSSYVEPLDTFCDMEHLLRAEAWPPSVG